MEKNRIPLLPRTPGIPSDGAPPPALPDLLVTRFSQEEPPPLPPRPPLPPLALTAVIFQVPGDKTTVYEPAASKRYSGASSITLLSDDATTNVSTACLSEPCCKSYS